MAGRTIELKEGLNPASTFGKVIEPVHAAVANFLGRRVTSFFDTGVSAGVLEIFADRYTQGHFGLIAQGPHLFHGDSWALIEQARTIKKRTGAKGFLTHISHTLITGEGNQKIPHFWYKLMEPALKANDIILVPVVTPNDYTRMLANSPDKQATLDRIQTINMVAMQRTMNARLDNLIVWTIPEGSIEAGRKNAEGQLNGIREIKDTNLPQILADNVRARGGNAADFVVLPIGIWGSEKILDPATYKISPEVYLALLLNGVVLDWKFANAQVGYPFGKAEFRQYLQGKKLLDEVASDRELAKFMDKNPKTFFDYLMGERIAPLVPLQYQGVYRKPKLVLTR